MPMKSAASYKVEVKYLENAKLFFDFLNLQLDIHI